MWVRLTPPEKSQKQWLWHYFLWLLDYSRWRLNSAKRAIKHPTLWWKRRKAAKRLNKYLLKEAKAISKLPPHTPPTSDEIKAFVDWAEHSGLRFTHRISPAPKLALNSREVDLTKTGIHYGN